MLTGCKIAFLGGDARQIEVIQHCSDLDASIILYGYENLKNEFSGAIKKSITPDCFQDMDAIILPVTGMREDGKIDSCFTNKELKLTEEHFKKANKNVVVFTGIANEKLTGFCTENQRCLIELMNLDEVAILNSIPTAEGAILMAIQNTDFTLHGSNAVVLGLGRVGITLARTLQGVGANVFLGARKPEDLARAREMSLQGFHLDELPLIAEKADIIFNTVPATILDASVLVKIQPHALIIDLASKPGGTDFRYADKRGIKAMLAPGLPGIVAPKTAGKIIANSIARLLVEHKSKLGGEI
ncbi:dipicolinic acid synthetase subunit A [Desulfuribacillus stibiiarsenatis]|uniref:Dipicolinic acid synthetase subunit A n=1 Tax=Desulfuribacillus stibiiarsenatis TaxID=1390249 RepID=A0A1E5L7A3_9FIRM|nr:dipicolinate synthase subunit DpsA [Desulfuribacillus stibiiarsenatis]OEH85869.1 dipicolinic acid synthetase subunit A [Desulfuribacillus stibiiarsenatis]